MPEKNSIQKLYDDPKSKGFVNHLINAYIPTNKSLKVWEFKPKQKHKCSTCGKELISVEEVLNNIGEKQEDIKNDLMEFLRKSVNGEPTENPYMKHAVGNKILAWTGENTDTTLCLKCITDILELVQMGLLSSDKNITWIVSKMRRDQYFNQFYENKNISFDEKGNVKKIQNKVEKKKVATFGDLEVLQELKRKMEKEDEKK